MFKRIVCCTLSMVMILLTVTALPAWAADPEQNTAISENETILPQSEVALTSNTSVAPAVNINITDGSIRVAVGTHCRLVHDDYEVAYISAFLGALTVIENDTVLANMVGTTSLSVSYYTEGSTDLSYMSVDVIIYDAEGTIDLTTGNVFVEKGKSYVVNFGGYDAVTLVSNNTSIISVTSTYMITANQTGSINVWGQYFNAEGQYSIGGTVIDVFEGADIADDTYFFMLCHKDMLLKDNRKFLHFQYGSPSYPELQYHHYNDHLLEKIIIQQAEGGYYIGHTFLALSKLYWLVVQENDEVIFGPVETTTPMLWKILINEDGELIFTPKGRENDRLVLTLEGNSANSDVRVIVEDYYEISKAKTWELYGTTIRINNYYDKSLQDNDAWDDEIISLIPEANDFAAAAIQSQFVGIEMQMGISPTATTNAWADSPECPSYVDTHCTCSPNHHKEVGLMAENLNSTTFPRQKNEISVLWADRFSSAYCEIQDGVHSSWAAIAYVDPSCQSCILFTTISKGSGTISVEKLRYKMGISLAHEIGHTFGLSEQYGTAAHDELNSTEYSCIMEKYDAEDAQDFYGKLESGDALPFCSICEGKLDNLIYKKLHHGNQ